MHGHPKHTITTQRRPATLGHASGAVTWIDPSRAIVARTVNGDAPTVTVVEHGLAETIPYLARVVDAIGDRERVLILGPDSMRVELEREYVAIHHRPDRLLDVEVSAKAEDETDLIRRLEVLTAG